MSAELQEDARTDIQDHVGHLAYVKWRLDTSRGPAGWPVTSGHPLVLDDLQPSGALRRVPGYVRAGMGLRGLTGRRRAAPFEKERRRMLVHHPLSG